MLSSRNTNPVAQINFCLEELVDNPSVITYRAFSSILTSSINSSNLFKADRYP